MPHASRLLCPPRPRHHRCDAAAVRSRHGDARRRPTTCPDGAPAAAHRAEPTLAPRTDGRSPSDCRGRRGRGGCTTVRPTGPTSSTTTTARRSRARSPSTTSPSWRPTQGVYEYPAGPPRATAPTSSSAAAGATRKATYWRVDWNTLADPACRSRCGPSTPTGTRAPASRPGPPRPASSRAGMEQALVVSSQGAWLHDLGRHQRRRSRPRRQAHRRPGDPVVRGAGAAQRAAGHGRVAGQAGGRARRPRTAARWPSPTMAGGLPAARVAAGLQPRLPTARQEPPVHTDSMTAALEAAFQDAGRDHAAVRPARRRRSGALRDRQLLDGGQPGRHPGRRRRLEVLPRRRLVAAARPGAHPEPLVRGYTNRWYVSRLDLGQGVVATERRPGDRRRPAQLPQPGPAVRRLRPHHVPARPRRAADVGPALARRQPQPVRRLQPAAAPAAVRGPRLGLRHHAGPRARRLVLRRGRGGLLGGVALARRGLRAVDPAHAAHRLLDGRLRRLQARPGAPGPLRRRDEPRRPAELRRLPRRRPARDPAFGGRCTSDGGTGALVGNARWTPYRIAQGDLDQLVPFTSVEAQVARFDALGLRHRFVRYPGEDHLVFATQDRFDTVVDGLGPPGCDAQPRRHRLHLAPAPDPPRARHRRDDRVLAGRLHGPRRLAGQLRPGARARRSRSRCARPGSRAPDPRPSRPRCRRRSASCAGVPARQVVRRRS